MLQKALSRKTEITKFGPKKRGRRGPYVSHRFDRLESLVCFPEVKKRILDGWQATRVLGYIFDEVGEGEKLGITRKSALNLLRAYRASLRPAEIVRDAFPSIFFNAIEEISAGVEEIKELNALYQAQIVRVDKAIELEKKMKFLNRTTVWEIKEARKILTELLDKKIDLGLLPTNLGDLDLSMPTKDYGSEALNRVMANPQSRYNVLRVMQTL